MSVKQAIKYGNIIPGSDFMISLLRQSTISREAKKRLKRLDHYRKYGNGRLTCRYFGISPQTFYRWKNRFDPYDLTTLEDQSQKPHKVRQPQVPPEVVERIQRLSNILDGEKISLAKLARRRKWKPRYATRKPKGYKIKGPGDLVEVDTLRVSLLPDEVRYRVQCQRCYCSIRWPESL